MKPSSLVKMFLVGAALTAGSLHANSIILTSTGFNGGLDGGEFTAVTSNDGTFVTFCIEDHVSVTLNAFYNYTIDPNALLQNDPISKGTEWLYSKFILGTLGSGNALGTGSYYDNHNVNAGLLQQAFWMLEDEIPVAANPYLTQAENAFGGTLAGAQADAGPSSTVKALNIWDAIHGDVQSQLIFVPDGAMTAALLGFGLLSLAAFRRKL